MEQEGELLGGAGLRHLRKRPAQLLIGRLSNSVAVGQNEERSPLQSLPRAVSAMTAQLPPEEGQGLVGLSHSEQHAARIHVQVGAHIHRLLQRNMKKNAELVGQYAHQNGGHVQVGAHVHRLLQRNVTKSTEVGQVGCSQWGPCAGRHTHLQAAVRVGARSTAHAQLQPSRQVTARAACSWVPCWHGGVRPTVAWHCYLPAERRQTPQPPPPRRPGMHALRPL